VGLERGPLSLVSTTEELLGRNSSGSGLERREYGCGNPLRRPHDSLYQQKLALTSLTSGSHSVGILRSRIKATEFPLTLPYRNVTSIHACSETSLVVEGRFAYLTDPERYAAGSVSSW
jgi:hypothetical protein